MRPANNKLPPSLVDKEKASVVGWLSGFGELDTGSPVLIPLKLMLLPCIGAAAFHILTIYLF